MAESVINVVIDNAKKRKNKWVVTSTEGYIFVTSGKRPVAGKSYQVTYDKSKAEDVLERKEVPAKFDGPLVLRSGSVPTTEG